MSGKYLQQVCAAVWLATVVATPALGGDGLAFGPQKDLDLNGYAGRATIALKETSIGFGMKFEVDTRFDALSNNEFYNLYYDRLTDAPAALALFDADKRYVGDLLQRSFGSYRGPTPSNWLRLEYGTYVGTKLRVTIGAFPFMDRLSPGTYYLQMIYHESFVAPAPGAIAPLPGETPEQVFERAFHKCQKPDICRSNVVKIELK